MGFERDKLGREKYADFLTEIIVNSEKYKRISDSESMVIAIDSSWGTGKTTFLDMWIDKLNIEEKKIAVIKYNAWKNDFVDEPLESIIYNIVQHDMFYIDKEKGNFKGSVKEILVCVEKIVKSLIKYRLKKTLGGDAEENVEEVINDIVDAVSEGTENIAEISQKEIAEMSSFYEAYENYNNAVSLMKKLLSKAGEKKKIVVIIDELDRCKPLFAIKVLESIKHILDTKNVTFVFSLDMTQLSHSVKCIYGQDMDANGYLCRFFDYISKMPKANKLKYVEGLLEDNKLLRKEFVKVNSNYSVENLNFLDFFGDIIDRFNLSLRDINTIYNNFLIFENINLKNTDNYNAYYMYLFLIALKYKRIDLYNRLFIDKQDIVHEALIITFINEHRELKVFLEKIIVNEIIIENNYNVKKLADSFNTKILDFCNDKILYKEGVHRMVLEINNNVELSNCLFYDDLLKWNDIKNKRLGDYIQEKLEFFNFENQIVEENESRELEASNI